MKQISPGLREKWNLLLSILHDNLRVKYSSASAWQSLYSLVGGRVRENLRTQKNKKYGRACVCVCVVIINLISDLTYPLAPRSWTSYTR